MRAIFFLLIAVAAYSHSYAEYQVFYENGKAGLRDESGKVILPAAFDALGWTDGSFSVVNQVTGFRQKGKWGLINLKKEIVTKAEYETVTSPGGDRIVASRYINPYTIKYGCIDLTGKITVPFLYDGIEVHGLRAIVFVKNGTRYEHGVIDLNDRSILPMRYRDIRPIGTLRFAIQNFQQRTALFSEDGVQLTDFSIDSISVFRKGYAIIYQNFQRGLMDRDGNVVISPAYRELRVTDGVVEGRTADSWKLLNTQNQELKTIEADELIVDGNQYRITRAGRFGVINDELETVVPVAFDHLTSFAHGLSVARKDGKFGIISRSSREVFPFEFDSLVLEAPFVRAMNVVQGARHWMVYDTFNVRKTERPYDELHRYNGKFFPVRSHGYWGAVDRYGKEMLSCVYDSIMGSSYDAAAVRFKGLYGVIGFDGRWRVYPQKDEIAIVDNDLYLEKKDSLTFLKSFHGTTIYVTANSLVPVDDHFEERLADGTIRNISHQGIITTVASAPQVSNTEEVFEESEGLRGIRRNGRFGFVDSRGRLRVANRYERIGRFSEGLAPVMLLGKWGYVNKEDRIVINPNFDTASEFRNGVATVPRAGKTGIIDREGRTILPVRYDSIVRRSNLYLLYEGGRYGLSNLQGHVLIEPRFLHLEMLPNNLVIVQDDNRWGVLTPDGMPVIPLIYGYITFNPATNQFLANRKGEWKTIRN